MNRKHGFTLIELLTVVLILGILTSFALPQYRKSIQRAAATNALINLKTIFDAAKRYNSSNSAWPSSFKGLDVEFLDADTDGNIGDFRYSFSTSPNAVSACRIVGTAANTAFCLRAYYSKIVSGVQQRDVYTCTYLSNKYQSLCESMATCPAEGSECIIE